MTSRPFSESDHATIASWWRAHDHAVLGPSALPGTGLIVERSDGTPVAAAFLYLTNSQLAYLGWFVGDPEAKRYEMHEAMTRCVTDLTLLARSLDVQVVVSVTGSDGLARIIERSGSANAGSHKLLIRGM